MLAGSCESFVRRKPDPWEPPNLELLKAFLDAGVPPDSIDPETGKPVILLAVTEGNEAAVRELIRRNANIESARPRDFTALMEAAGHGQQAIVDVLIDSRAKLDAVVEGESPLTLAAANGHEGVVRTLIEKGANVNLGPDMGSRAVRPVPSTTALHEASAGLGYATEAHARIVGLLLEKGADASTVCFQNYTALDYALGLDEQYKRVRDIDPEHVSLFKIVNMLIGAGACWNYGMNGGDHINIADRFPVMKQLLLDKGAVASRVPEYNDPHTGPSEVASLLVMYAFW